MLVFLSLFFASVTITLLPSEKQPVKSIPIQTLSLEQAAEMSQGYPRHDFTIHSRHGVTDAHGNHILEAELPVYLEKLPVKRDAFVFLWIMPDSLPAPLFEYELHPWVELGIPRLHLSYHPDAVHHNRTHGNPRYADLITRLRRLQEVSNQELAPWHESPAPNPDSEPEMDEQSARRAAVATSILEQLERIWAQHGWISEDQVGYLVPTIQWGTLLRASQDKRKQHLPMLRNAVEQGRAPAQILARLEDQTLLGDGLAQRYGTQLKRDGQRLYFPAIEDPDRIDERRSAVGLPPMAATRQRGNARWDLIAHKKEYPKLLKKLPEYILH